MNEDASGKKVRWENECYRINLEEVKKVREESGEECGSSFRRCFSLYADSGISVKSLQTEVS